MTWEPRLRTVLITVNLLILALLAGGVVILRLYESVLIRRTEADLIAQGAHVAATYRQLLRDETARRGGDAGDAGVPLEVPRGRGDDGFHVVGPRLDLATNPILPPPPPGREPERPADPAAVAAGRWLSPALADAQRITLAGIRVLDHRGTVVATTRGELGLSLAHRDEVARALSGEHVSVMVERHSDEPRPPLDSLSRGTRVRVIVAMPVIDRDRLVGAVVLSRTPMSIRQSLYRLRWHIPVGVLVLLAVVTAVSLITSRTIVRPMHELIRQAERVAGGDRRAVAPLERPGTHEVRQVSEAVAAMARALQQRAEYIDAFARGVSHEFKTPLASMRGAVELLRDHLDEMTAAERERFLANLEEDTARLERLLTRLTELAHADVSGPGTETAEVDAVARDLASRYRGDGLQLTLEAGAGACRVPVAREVLETVLTNLLDNARAHGGEGVRVTLSTRLADGRPPRVRLEVADDGPGISEANADKVFQRFFTTARDRGGSGLGLAIVKALVEVHGGAVRLRSRPSETVFTVELPAVAP